MNQPLADEAVAAIRDPDITAIPGLCERFVRECIQKVYGGEFDDYFRPNAHDTALAWQAGGYSVTGDPEVGDVLGIISFVPGHIGIYTGPDRGVAENSSTRIGRVQGAKGYRSLSQFTAGRKVIVIRLPDPTPTDFITIGGTIICQAPEMDGSHLVPIREWADFFSFDLEGSPGDGFTFDSQAVPGPVVMRGGHAYGQLRSLADGAGLKVLKSATGVVQLGK